jgi:Ser/Thr protein kinase RdoA (MazF antagonist)
VANRLGIPVDSPVSLRSTNNIVVWLKPSPVVAKLSRTRTTAAKELGIAVALADRRAPIVTPAPGVGGELYEVDGYFVTLWRYVAPDAAARATSEAIAVALHRLHLALASLDDAMPLGTLESQLRDAAAALEQPDFAPALTDPDRALLHDTLVVTLANLSQGQAIAIHGSPHDMNIVVEAGQPLFIDLETVQRGPVEWDLAHLAPDVALHYPAAYDDERLAIARIAVSAATSTWCWDALHRGPDMRSHAEHHLAQVRLAQT